MACFRKQLISLFVVLSIRCSLYSLFSLFVVLSIRKQLFDMLDTEFT